MGFLPQLVNVKIYFFSVTALTGFVTDYTMSPVALAGFGAFIVMMGVIATSTVDCARCAAAASVSQALPCGQHHIGAVAVGMRVGDAALKAFSQPLPVRRRIRDENQERKRDENEHHLYR